MFIPIKNFAPTTLKFWTYFQSQWVLSLLWNQALTT